MVSLNMDSSISIIIPAWNESKIISKTSNYIQKLKLPFKYSELIFVAGGTDNTYKICKEIRSENFNNVITLKQNPEEFKSGALIKGINKSKGDYIILIDADVFVPPNLAIEIVKSLRNFDGVNCNFIPLMEKGFWYDFYTIFKLIWGSNPKSLSRFIGGATISLKREIINDIGINNLFSNKTTAGVDYYMSLVLKEENKRMGLVKNVNVLMPRPNNIKDFLKDQKRWLTAFYFIHQENKLLILSNFILNISSCLFPPLIFLSNIKKMSRISLNKYPKIRYFFILFLVDFLINLFSLRTILKKLTKRLKPIRHFKGVDRYEV